MNDPATTPLAHAAGHYPYPELVGYLLKEGADVNEVNQKERPPRTRH